MKPNRRKTEWTTGKIVKLVITIVLIAAVLTTVVILLRNRVKAKYAGGENNDVLSATVTRGTISTAVSGSGTLVDDDVEKIGIPDGVELRKIYVSRGDLVQEGDLLASVNVNSVLKAMYDLTGKIGDIDEEIGDASKETVNSTITASVAGRVKKIYAAAGDNVASVMYEHGALALLSLDGTMSFDIENDTLAVGDTVSITVEEKKYTGTVTASVDGVTTLSVTDDGPALDAEAVVLDAEGRELGRGTLSVTKPLKVVGYAGTVGTVYTAENRRVAASTSLFRLTDTAYTANYEALLDERADLEEELQELIRIYKEGAIYASLSGTVKSVDASDESDKSKTEADSSSAASGTSASMSSAYSLFGMSTAVAVTDTAAESGSDSQSFSVSPDETMSVEVSVDETDILAVAVGQSAAVTVDSINGETFEGTVTAIDRAGTASDGVTTYTATITIPKTKEMLSGMSASATIHIDAVEDALLIPADALNKTRTTYYVYTSYDKETGTYGDMIEVTIGIVNSDYAEITSGLSQGDTVWYTKKEEFSFYKMFTQMSSGMGGYGGMPSGGRRK